MNITLLRSWWNSRTRWERGAIAVWCAILLVVSVRVFLEPAKRTVYPIFSGSAQLWWSGADLYEPHRPDTVQGGYRYSPTFAILLTPFAVFPDSVGGVLWRLVSTAALLRALAWLAHSVLPFALSKNQFAWLTLLCVPLTMQSLNNGQANMLVIAAMLGTMAAVREQRWNLACALMTLAFVCKVYPLALGMLLVMLYPRQLLVRMALAIVISLLVPLVMQHPEYVFDQYGRWAALLRADDRTNTEMENKHRDLWLLIDLYGLPISRRFYTLLQILSGVGIAAVCWIRQRQGWSQKALLTSTLALAVAWMLLLGPVVESSTFLLLAPSLACSVLAVMRNGVWRWRLLLLGGSAGLFVLAALLGGIANTAKLNIIGLHPWASLLYFTYLLTEPQPAAAESSLMVRRAA